MKCQIMFSWKNKNIINLLSAELAKNVVKVKSLITTAADVILIFFVFALIF